MIAILLNNIHAMKNQTTESIVTAPVTPSDPKIQVGVLRHNSCDNIVMGAFFVFFATMYRSHKCKVMRRVSNELRPVIHT